MERLCIKSLILIFLLSGCQIVEVSNNDSAEFIPDLSQPKVEETIQISEDIIFETVESPAPEIKLSLIHI